MMHRMKHWSASMVLGAVFFGGTVSAQELTFRYNFDNIDEIRAGLDVFEERNPGITVILERIAFKDARDQFIRETATGAGPDVAHMAYVWIKDLGTAEACMRINDMIDATGIGENGFDGFIANDLVLGEDNESIYGIPFATDTWAMIYNTVIMEEAGIEKVPETWDELLEASRKAKEVDKIGFGFAAGASSANTIWFLANFNWWSDGGSLVVDDGSGGYKVGITAEQVADVIDYYDTYLKEDLTTPGSLGLDAWNDPAVLEPMVAGDQFAALVPVFTARDMFTNWRGRNPDQELPFTTAMTPSGSGQPTTHLGGQSLCVNANTEHPNEAWKLMQWLNSWEFFDNYNTGYYPSQQALLAKRPFPEEMVGFQKQFTEGARSWGPYARGPAAIAQMWNQTSRSFGAAFIGEKTSMEAAEEMLEFVDGLL
ncbi:MAG: ABC transporter substrate-binding protein [Geminicoccales bacterium]